MVMSMSDVFLLPKGRLSLSGFWGAIIGLIIFIGGLSLSLLFLPLFVSIYHLDLSPQLNDFIQFISEPSSVFLLCLVPFVWMTIAIFAKRLHDLDRSANWLWVLVVPVIGWLWLLYELGFHRGSRGENRYGECPVWTQADRLMQIHKADEDMA